ncbi:MAG: hypothetical protein KKD64_14380 [Alphaproteobacteria bacterium]|jgi:hypothetical protein|nr:hypothetical protein [Alphaproteobacteria bacterium]MBU0794945.1 hypothetical protein [Alphaproteobacteria bacterium]MBU0875325.1 hypothetical protein [Alphaproteobacteria bacterium]MBU1770825.1 hypothetical protein [Alphaproteobacteria bacterium]
MTTAAIDLARKAAAQHLQQQGYTAEAALVAQGQGDDFAEVRMALSLLKIMQPAPPPLPKRGGRRLFGEEC